MQELVTLKNSLVSIHMLLAPPIPISPFFLSPTFMVIYDQSSIFSLLCLFFSFLHRYFSASASQILCFFVNLTCSMCFCRVWSTEVKVWAKSLNLLSIFYLYSSSSFSSHKLWQVFFVSGQFPSNDTVVCFSWYFIWFYSYSYLFFRWFIHCAFSCVFFVEQICVSLDPPNYSCTLFWLNLLVPFKLLSHDLWVVLIEYWFSWGNN